MNDSSKLAGAQRFVVGAQLAVVAVASAWLAFYIGALGQRVRRAHDVLLGVQRSSRSTELQLITEGLIDTSHAILMVRAWLFAVAIGTLVLVAALDWAPARPRILVMGVVIVCWTVLLLTQSIV